MECTKNFILSVDIVVSPYKNLQMGLLGVNEVYALTARNNKLENTMIVGTWNIRKDKMHGCCCGLCRIPEWMMTS